MGGAWAWIVRAKSQKLLTGAYDVLLVIWASVAPLVSPVVGRDCTTVRARLEGGPVARACRVYFMYANKCMQITAQLASMYRDNNQNITFGGS